ncbi:MAG TPA: eight-cysteine-cluster domain-containing protein [Candidatus Nanoarchaeia archaeon]|nr:eight-cysteine-cluster domain-containing protein [Candidatus Nanoarchaeia archaeon]
MKMGLLTLIALMMAVIALSACKPEAEPAQPPANLECATDFSNCVVGGCSGQVCTTADKAADLITTCEHLPEYDCLKLTSCGCIDNKCAWKETTEYNACINTKTKGI